MTKQFHHSIITAEAAIPTALLVGCATAFMGWSGSVVVLGMAAGGAGVLFGKGTVASLGLIIAAWSTGNGLTSQQLNRLQQTQPKPEDMGRSYLISGRVARQWPTEFGAALMLQDLKIHSPKDVQWRLSRLIVYTPKLEYDLRRGVEIQTWCRLDRRRRAQPIAWPIRELQERYLPRFTGRVKSLKLLTVQSDQTAVSQHAKERSQLNEGLTQLIRALTYGEPSQIWNDRLSVFGVGHLLAISGLHCGFIAVLLIALSAPWPSPWLRRCSLVGGLIAFGAWLDWNPSVTRAALMLCLWQLIPILGRKRGWFRLWFTLLLGSLLAAPQLFLMRGFWYSFAASLGIILGARAREPSPLVHPWAFKLRWIFAILAAQLMVTPINLLFGVATSPTTFFWNLCSLVFLLLLAMLATLAWLAVLCPWLVQLANGAERLSVSALSQLAELPLHLEWVRYPASPAITLAVLILMAMALSWRKREWRWCLCCGCLALFCVRGLPDRGERMVMVDVGQGLCMVHIDDEGGATLFDAGGRLPPDIGLPHLLRLLGARQVKAAFISHLNADHYLLLEQLDVTFPLYVPEIARADFQHHPQLRRFDIRGVAEGAQFPIGSFYGRILWPKHDAVDLNINEQSLVMRLDGQNRSILLTGDAGRWMERRIGDLEPVNVLQVGHHGSRTATSQSFVHQLSPDLALISSGWNNRFGHPHPEVVATLQNSGAKVVVTHEHKGPIRLDRNTGKD